MKPDLSDWDEDIPTDPEEEYHALVRALKRTKGFGLLFVECLPVAGEELIEKIKRVVSPKRVEVLRLEKPIDNLYELVANLPQRDEINVLFVSGIEESLYEYEEFKREIGWKSEEIYAYSWKGVPNILMHLNQQRERFRDDFNICFVFLLRRFAIDYFIQRAPDFFDWRSGLFKFPSEQELVVQKSERLILDAYYEKYLALTPKERHQKILEIQELLAKDNQTADYKADLLFERGNLLYAAKEYEVSIASYDQALKLKPDKDEAWYNRGKALYSLGRLEETIESYDQALKFKPDDSIIWDSRGIALRNLGCYEEAIASFDQALKINPNNPYTWNDRGLALYTLKRYEQAIDSCNKAIEIKPNFEWPWNNRGISLEALEKYQEALISYEQAIKINPDYLLAWRNRGIVLEKLGRYEESLASYQEAVRIKPDNQQAQFYRAKTLFSLGRLEEASASFEEALKIEPNDYATWSYRGYTLYSLRRFEEALASIEQALKINPDDNELWNSRGYLLLKQDSTDGTTPVYGKGLEIGINLQDIYNKKVTNSNDIERYKSALTSFEKALENQQDSPLKCVNKSFALYYLGCYEEALASCNKAIKLRYNDYVAWSNKGFILIKLERYQEAITSFDKVLDIQPNHHNSWYNKACCYALQGNINLAIESLKQAINLNPEECREMAKNDSDFDNLQEDERFQALIQVSSIE